jgi:hypothetical protein
MSSSKLKLHHNWRPADHFVLVSSLYSVLRPDFSLYIEYFRQYIGARCDESTRHSAVTSSVSSIVHICPMYTVHVHMCVCVCVFSFSLHIYFVILKNYWKCTKCMASNSPRLEQLKMLIYQALKFSSLKGRKPWQTQKLSIPCFPFWPSLCPPLRIFLFLWLLTKFVCCLPTVYCDKIIHSWKSEISPNFADPCEIDYHYWPEL